MAQLSRAEDFLETHKAKPKQEPYFRLADLLDLDVEVVFYDTTSLQFEANEEDGEVGQDDEVTGSRSTGAKSYCALRKRDKSKNGRADAPLAPVEFW